MRFRPKAVSLFRPPSKIRSLEWLPKYVLMPKGTETAGKPFSLADFPHADGPCDAVDNPIVRVIILPWGTRLGKTTLCLSLFAFIAETDPRNMMFASVTRSSAAKVIGERLYPLFESTAGLRHQLLPEHRRSDLLVKLNACRVYVGWSGSSSSLADVGAAFGCGNEIDKWKKSASEEADPLKLFLNRFKGFPDSKVILESTPTIKGRSRIERLTAKSKQFRRQCQCPHCGTYQILKKGDGKSPGGIRWLHDSAGRSQEELAFASAWYECERCLGRIENHHRAVLLRSGVWVPNGCSVSLDGAIVGTAINDSSDTWAFGPLASWYAMSQTWGDFARQWVAAQGKPKELQDVFNSYMAETWEVRKTKTEPQIVGERLSGTVPRSFVPNDVEFLTVTVDRQESEGGFCPFVVMGHGSDDRAWVIDYGRSVDLKTIWESVVRQQFQFENDSTKSLIARMTGVDSGWDAIGTYEFCDNHELLTIPLKGSSNDLNGAEYRPTVLSSMRQGAGRLILFVNTDTWETNIAYRLEKLLANEPGSLTLFKEAKFDRPFLEDLCNGTLSDKLDKRGEPVLTWKKKDENVSNDWRDCIRYGLCLAKYLRDKDAEDDRPVYGMPSDQDDMGDSIDE